MMLRVPEGVLSSSGISSGLHAGSTAPRRRPSLRIWRDEFIDIGDLASEKSKIPDSVPPCF
jgi:hypothetical protein